MLYYSRLCLGPGVGHVNLDIVKLLWLSVVLHSPHCLAVDHDGEGKGVLDQFLFHYNLGPGVQRWLEATGEPVFVIISTDGGGNDHPHPRVEEYERSDVPVLAVATADGQVHTAGVAGVAVVRGVELVAQSPLLLQGGQGRQ